MFHQRAGADGRRQPQRRIRSKRGASDNTTSSWRSSHGSCFECIFNSAFETGGSAQDLLWVCEEHEAVCETQSRHSLVSTASERETILDGRIQLTPLSGFFETLNLKHVFSPMHLQGFYTSNIFLLLLLLL